MKKFYTIIISMVLALTLCLVTVIPAIANDIDSSTMIFEGELTDEGDGVYTGTIPMTIGEYYVLGGPGESMTGGAEGPHGMGTPVSCSQAPSGHRLALVPAMDIPGIPTIAVGTVCL